MNNLLLTVDAGAIDWARAQFALTAIYHWLFVPLTLGLALIMAIVETCYYNTGKQFWKDAARFWQKLFGVNFAMGVATGIILEFEFGTNWSNYSWIVGDIFGAPLAVEGIVAFFMESTFVAVMFFGWQKVSRGFHLASTWLTGIGATISAWWILVANSWMQYPVGCEFNPDTMRHEMVSFSEVALSPFAIDKFFHTVISTWIIGAIFVVAVCSWYLLKKRDTKLAVESIKIASVVGLVSSLLAAATGDESAYRVAQVQPMKLAAMEGLYNGGTNQGITVFAMINPFKQPDYKNEKEPPMKMEVPGALSFLATRNMNGYVPGVNDLINGYTTPDGKMEISYNEKIEKGKLAITALGNYRKAKAAGNEAEAQRQLPILKVNMPYFGYGYIKNVDELVPPIPVCFYAFRIMVGLGTLFILFFAVMVFIAYRKDIANSKRWFLWLGIILLPMGYLGSESGWLVAEFGRQPWTIQDMLPTTAAISNISAGAVAFTFFLFITLFTTMLAVEINILLKQIKKGPQYER
ncbi:cytochrome ubiquinol oxidase subunit I [Prevotella sp. OH937_COT-195]|uniref:cytochrome ubiquinol oxidase subunit I n=1 Tax=Prevotella sp. OH937_COT-195 TaxID=2491051 RepID=UPI000F64E793|nr:cytochrome ubiquinol oxidase subunit I [Prevotella sp. OH937_COT-195]RRC96813.1 cytochrome ubiquinol oxidase subunit I [Prevotella sp. OH937_COT-195]